MLKSKLSWWIFAILLILTLSVGMHYRRQGHVSSQAPNVAAIKEAQEQEEKTRLLARTFQDYQTGKGTLTENPTYRDDQDDAGVATIRYKMDMPNAAYTTGPVPVLRSHDLKKGSDVKIVTFQNLNSLDFHFFKLALPASPSTE